MHTTIIPIISLSTTDIELLSACIWKSIHFFAKMSSFTQTVNGHVIYQCIFGWKKGNDVALNLKSFRYSELLELYNHLTNKYKLSNKLPSFPPKHWWGNTYKSVIEQRINAFDPIFRRLNSIPDINNDDVLCKFFNIDLSDDKYQTEPKILDISKYMIGDTFE